MTSDDIVYPDMTVIPYNTKIGNGVRFGKQAIIGSYSTIGDTVIFDSDPVIRENVTMGDNVLVGEKGNIGAYLTVGNHAAFGDFCSFSDGLKAGNKCRFGSLNVIGEYATVGESFDVWGKSTIGKCSTFGSYGKIRHRVRIEPVCAFGVHCSFEDDVIFGEWSNIGAGSSIGDGAVIGANSIIGDDCKIGNNAEISHGVTFGESVRFGKNCSYNGFKFIKFMGLSNVSASGRRINVFFDGYDVMLEAGCFWGTSEEFCRKAESEGKREYSKIIRAISEALIS